MAKANKHSVVLPDGNIATRNSANRVYTHVVAYGPTPIAYTIKCHDMRIARITQNLAQATEAGNVAEITHYQVELDQANVKMEELKAEAAAGVKSTSDRGWTAENWCGSFQLAQKVMGQSEVRYWQSLGRDVRIVEIGEVILKD